MLEKAVLVVLLVMEVAMLFGVLVPAMLSCRADLKRWAAEGKERKRLTQR